MRVAWALLFVLGVACSDPAPLRPQSGSPTSEHPRTWALLISGGGRPAINYQSHLLHVRELIDLLIASGVPRKRIVVFASDGADPEPDLAVRDVQAAPDFWLIDGLRIAQELKPKLRYENSEISGMSVRPATREALNRWVEEEAPRLAPGDTLLIYVTDHGTKNRLDLDNNAITLWGEELSVNEFKQLIARLPQQVRVVALMSQCFSGSFANAMYDMDEPDRTSGQVCGYYSSNARRRAYGCYAENRGRSNVGHSFRFFEALRVHGDLVGAHGRVLLTDRTPDVPNRTSDYYLERLLRARASRRGMNPDHLVDELLEEAVRQESKHALQFAQIDHIGQAFGSFSPRSLRELEQRAREIPGLGKQLRAHARRWKTALDDLKRENLDRFFEVYPGWRDYLKAEVVRDLEQDEKRRLKRSFLEDLAAFTRLDIDTRDRLHALRTIATEAEMASYRMDVRRAAVLRIRALLTRIAGLVYLDRSRNRSVRAEFETLEQCEALELGTKPDSSARERGLPPPFPPLVDESELLAAVLPGWMGIEFRPVRPKLREQLQLERGSIRVTKVIPGSPAERAGILTRDIVVGPPRAPFVERHQIREWVMTSVVGEVRRLVVLRDKGRKVVTIEVGAAPI